VKNNKTRYWIIGLGLGGLLLCGGLLVVALIFARNLERGPGATFGDAIAIVRVEGTILAGEAPPANPFSGEVGAAYSQTIVDNLKKAEADSEVKAIVLYVDSPGGSVFASDEIYQKIITIEKPVITSMNSLAASGGYYVSAPTDEIWASPHTLTCSIGVILQFPNVEEFAESYGVSWVTVTSGKFKDLGNPFREFSAEDEALLQEIVDETFDAFVAIVAEGRDMGEAKVREIADGRICTGKQAQTAGLVDELGYLPEVIERAAELGGIEGEPRIIEYDREPGLFELLGANLNRPSPVQELQDLLHFHQGSPLLYLYVGP
jgi:protease-4